MRFHPSDRKALSLLAIFGMVGHLVIAAVCCAQGGAITQTVSAGSGSYVIICSPAGTERIPLADYLAGQRAGETAPGSGGSSIFGCAHCSLCGMGALASISLFLMMIAWPILRPDAGLAIAHIRMRRAFAARGPPLSLA